MGGFCLEHEPRRAAIPFPRGRAWPERQWAENGLVIRFNFDGVDQHALEVDPSLPSRQARNRADAPTQGNI
jgi:hypothetical protein